MKRLLRRLRVPAMILGLIFGAMQLVPYGWSHSNPPIEQDTPWPSADGRAIARISCYSCHSNETEWPAYSYVAPMSWLVRRDVDRGRLKLNFSEWPQDEDDIEEAIEMVEDRAMPPTQYTLIHRAAALTNEERSLLLRDLEKLEDSDEDGDDQSGSDDRGDDDGG